MINFKDPQLRYLIDYANMKQGLIKFQKFFKTKPDRKFFEKRLPWHAIGFAYWN